MPKTWGIGYADKQRFEAQSTETTSHNNVSMYEISVEGILILLHSVFYRSSSLFNQSC